MKLHIDIDLTPEEARRLLGLPDLQPLHDAYLARMQNFVDKGITPELVSEMVRSWSSMGGAGMTLIQQLLGSVAAGRSGDDDGSERRKR